jgi:hypothetical protein
MIIIYITQPKISRLWKFRRNWRQCGIWEWKFTWMILAEAQITTLQVVITATEYYIWNIQTTEMIGCGAYIWEFMVYELFIL